MFLLVDKHVLMCCCPFSFPSIVDNKEHYIHFHLFIIKMIFVLLVFPRLALIHSGLQQLDLDFMVTENLSGSDQLRSTQRGN